MIEGCVDMLSDQQIARLGRDGVITPYSPEQLQPASYDMRLGRELRVFNHTSPKPIDTKEASDRTHPLLMPLEGHLLESFALAVTQEMIRMPSNLAARVEGKSSLARLGLFVHVTAGFIDPGFEGYITLELFCTHARGMIIYPGMPICQLSFQHLEQHARVPYSGKYQGSIRPGPVPSKYWKNFKEHGGLY